MAELKLQPIQSQTDMMGQSSQNGLSNTQVNLPEYNLPDINSTFLGKTPSSPATGGSTDSWWTKAGNTFNDLTGGGENKWLQSQKNNTALQTKFSNFQAANPSAQDVTFEEWLGSEGIKQDPGFGWGDAAQTGLAAFNAIQGYNNNKDKLKLGWAQHGLMEDSLQLKQDRVSGTADVNNASGAIAAQRDAYNRQV